MHFLNGNTIGGNLDRLFDIYTPHIYNNDTPTPLVFWFRSWDDDGTNWKDWVVQGNNFHDNWPTINLQPIAIRPQSLSLHDTGLYAYP